MNINYFIGTWGVYEPIYDLHIKIQCIYYQILLHI